MLLKRPRTEEQQTPWPLKKPRLEPVVIQAPKKPEVYLKVKRNYLFHVQMVSILETLVLEMVRRREVEERTVAALGKGVYSQLGNMHWKVDEHLKYLTNFLKRKYSLEI